MALGPRTRLPHKPSAAALPIVVGLLLAGCSGATSKHATSMASPAPAQGPAPSAAEVARVGTTSLTGATYNHWMAIGAATVEMPPPGAPVPAPLTYQPPAFTECVAQLRAKAPSRSNAPQLKARCRRTYDGIRNRILKFLITGYWLRAEAAEEHASVTEAEVRRQFDDERRAGYPSAASFRRLQEASHQSVADLMFAVETQMLSAKLLEKFTEEHGHGSLEQTTISAFNRMIKAKWTTRTDCRPGYVVADCRQYRRP